MTFDTELAGSMETKILPISKRNSELPTFECTDGCAGSAARLLWDEPYRQNPELPKLSNRLCSSRSRGSPSSVIKLKECFTSKETTPSFTSVSPGLLLAPQGLQRGSLTLSSIDFAAVDQTFADTGKPHLALQELGRQLTHSTEFSERTREWVQIAFKEIDQFAHHYAYENSDNPLQAKIDTVGGIIHGGCSLGKDLVTLQVQLSLGPFLKPHEMQTVLQHIDNASTTVGAHYTQTIQTINPRFNSNSAAYKVGHFTGKYILPTIGPGVVRARPPNPTYLTTKAAQMLETLEARLAARSEAFFPELRPALPTGPRSLPTPRLPSTTKPPASLSRAGASKPPTSTEPTTLLSGEKVEASKLAERNIRAIKPQKYATSINSKVNLNAKMSAMEKVPNIAERIKTLPDGRIRYYKAERLSKTPGPTRGSSYVLEYNPKTGRVRGWDENYDHSGKVIRVHPKMINGQDIIGQHYPQTKSEIETLLNLKGEQW